MIVPQTLDHIPTYCQARVLILGVGNVLFGDDGFGPGVVEHLLDHYLVPDDVYAVDVGTGARKLLFTLTLSEVRPERIIIADAVDWGMQIGEVAEISVDELPQTKIDDFSLHQVPTSNMLRELQEHHGVNVTVIACDVGELPQLISPGLSQKVKEACAIASRLIAHRLALVPQD